VTSHTKSPRTTGNEAEDLTAQKKEPVFLITLVQSIHLCEKFSITKRQPSRNENTKETNIKNGTFSNLLNCERIQSTATALINIKELDPVEILNALIKFDLILRKPGKKCKPTCKKKINLYGKEQNG